LLGEAGRSALCCISSVNTKRLDVDERTPESLCSTASTPVIS
jgi:hypothetical protein